MNRLRWIVPLLLVVPLAGCDTTKPSAAGTSPPEVEVSLPVPDTITDFEVFTGRTQALNAADLRARVTGYLEKAPFQQGEDVKKGDVLFVIQQKPFEDAVRQARANRAQQQAQLEYNDLVYQRNRNLRGPGAVAIQDIEQSRAARDTSRAAVESADAALAIAQQNLDWSVIRAPFDGRISRRLVDPGNDVMADNSVLASLVELDKLYAYFDVDERTLLRINHLLPDGKVPRDAAKKLPVTLGLANERPEAFSHRGRLEFADNRVDANTGTLRMWGTFENPKRDLKPGLFIRVRLGIGQPRTMLFVAESALGSDQGRRFLYVVNGENRIVYTSVVIGQRKNGLIAIEEGLKGGERVVVNGLQRVRPQMEVEPEMVSMPHAAEALDRPVTGLKPSGDKGADGR